MVLRGATELTDRPAFSRRRLAALWMFGLMSILSLSIALPPASAPAVGAEACTATGNETVATTKEDYAPEEVVPISGTGYAPQCELTIKVTRPDGSVVVGDGSFEPGSDTVITAEDGTFAYDYQLDGIQGEYVIDVIGANGVVLATMTFNDSVNIRAAVGAATGAMGGSGNATGAGATATTLVIAKPTGTVEGDFLIAQITVKGLAAGAITPPTGWCTAGDACSISTNAPARTNGTGISQAVYYKFAGASEPATYTWTFPSSLRASGGIISYQGVDVTQPFDVASTSATNASTTPTATGVTTVTPQTKIVSFFGVNISTTFGAPATAGTEQYDVRNGTSGGAIGPSSSGYDTTQATAGATGTKSVTATSAEWIAHLVALRPATTDLSISKSDGASSVVAGTSVTYTVILTNTAVAGFGAAAIPTGVIVNDPIPAGTTAGALDSGCVQTGPGVGNNIRCTTSAPIASGGTKTFLITLNVAPGYSSSTLANTATIDSASVSANISDPDSSDYTATDTNTVDKVSDLSITKSGPASVNAGESLTYTMVVTNNGPSNAAGVSLSDVLPTELTGVQFCRSNPGANNCSGGNFAWPITNSIPVPTSGIIAPGAGGAITVKITGTIPASTADGTVISNTGTVSSTSTDPNGANNTSTPAVSTTITTSANLAVLKTASPEPVIAGNDLTYTIVVTNNGPSDAQSVTVTDALPAPPLVGPKFCVDSGSVCDPSLSVDPWTGSTNVGTISATSPNNTATVRIVATLPSNAGGVGSISNTASAESATTTDPDTDDNLSTTETTVATQADLVVTKDDSPDPVNAGATLEYTIEVDNTTGPSDAANVNVFDTLPTSGITNVRACVVDLVVDCTDEANYLAYAYPDDSPDPISVGIVPAGGSKFVHIRVDVLSNVANASTLTNSASATSDTADLDTANNTEGEDTTTSVDADMSVDKSGPATAVSPSTVTYTLTVHNGGPSDAASATVSDTLPSSLLVSHPSAKYCVVTNLVDCLSDGQYTAYTNGSAIALGNMPDGGADQVVKIKVDVFSGLAEGVTFTNSATADSGTPDSNPANDSDSVTTTVANNADLEVVKTDSPDPVFAGNNLNYTIVVTNHGPSVASTVTLTDSLPAGLTGAKFCVDIALACNPNSGATWTGSTSLGNVAVGAANAKTVRIVATVNPNLANNSMLSNTATASSLTPELTVDPHPNSDTETTQVKSVADLGVVKTGTGTNVPGGVLTYTVTTTNFGPSTAHGVTITDNIPTGTTFVGFIGTPGGCSYISTGTPRVSCSIGDLNSGDSFPFQFQVKVGEDVAGTITNVATAASSGSTEPVPDTTHPNSSTDAKVTACTAGKIGTSGPDVISGTTSGETICTLGGNDRVTASGGNDKIFGGSGDDLLYGGDGDDTIDGGTGNDRLFGENGNDTLIGGAGTDGCSGGAGTTTKSGCEA